MGAFDSLKEIVKTSITLEDITSDLAWGLKSLAELESKGQKLDLEDDYVGQFLKCGLAEYKTLPGSPFKKETYPKLTNEAKEIYRQLTEEGFYKKEN